MTLLSIIPYAARTFILIGAFFVFVCPCFTLFYLAVAEPLYCKRKGIPFVSSELQIDSEGSLKLKFQSRAHVTEAFLNGKSVLRIATVAQSVDSRASLLVGDMKQYKVDLRYSAHAGIFSVSVNGVERSAWVFPDSFRPIVMKSAWYPTIAILIPLTAATCFNIYKFLILPYLMK